VIAQFRSPGCDFNHKRDGIIGDMLTGRVMNAGKREREAPAYVAAREAAGAEMLGRSRFLGSFGLWLILGRLILLQASPNAPQLHKIQSRHRRDHAGEQDYDVIVHCGGLPIPQTFTRSRRLLQSVPGNTTESVTWLLSF